MYLRARVLVPVGHPLTAELQQQAGILLRTPGIGLEVLGHALTGEIKPDLTGVHQALCVLEDKGKLGKCSREVFQGVHAILRGGLFGLRELAQQHVVVYRP